MALDEEDKTTGEHHQGRARAVHYAYKLLLGAVLVTQLVAKSSCALNIEGS